MKHYLLFASHSYSYAIMRPLQDAIRARGDRAAWFLEDTCPDWLEPDEERLITIEDVLDFNPIACIVPGNLVYDFFPGVKVEVFHGYPVQKRGEEVDENFRMRGWFDIYCSPGPSSTEVLEPLERKLGYFKTYPTGWMTSDPFFRHQPTGQNGALHNPPCILYAPTFSKDVTSVRVMHSVIENMLLTTDWRFIFSFHPLIKDPQVIARYDDLANRWPGRVDFQKVNRGISRFIDSDVMLADSSGVIAEYLMFGKPVVTYRNTCPGPHIIDRLNLDEIPQAIALALSRPPEIMQPIHDYTHRHEYFFDGHNSERVLDAIDHFIANHAGKMPRRKPLNLVRKLKLRQRLGRKYLRYLIHRYLHPTRR